MTDEGSSSPRVVKDKGRLTLHRLRQRKLIQWSLGYLAAAWAAFEVVSEVAETFGWSVLVPRLAFVALAAGFALVLVLAWYHGGRGHPRASQTARPAVRSPVQGAVPAGGAPPVPWSSLPGICPAGTRVWARPEPARRP